MRRLRQPQKPEAIQPETPLPAAETTSERRAVPDTVEVIYGPLGESLNVAGLSVAQVHLMLRADFGMAPVVEALVNGEESNGDRTLQAGDVVEFSRPTGEKGAV